MRPASSTCRSPHLCSPNICCDAFPLHFFAIFASASGYRGRHVAEQHEMDWRFRAAYYARTSSIHAFNPPENMRQVGLTCLKILHGYVPKWIWTDMESDFKPCRQSDPHHNRIAPQQQRIDVDILLPILMFQSAMLASLQRWYAIAMATAARDVAPTCSNSNIAGACLIPFIAEIFDVCGQLSFPSGVAGSKWLDHVCTWHLKPPCFDVYFCFS